MGSKFPPKVFTSHSGVFKVVVEISDLTHTVFVINQKTKTQVSWKGPHRDVEVIWGPNEALVAINDFQTNGGDSAFLIALTGRVPKIVRTPDQVFDIKSLKLKYLGAGDLKHYRIKVARFVTEYLVEIDVQMQLWSTKPNLDYFPEFLGLIIFDGKKRTSKVFTISKT